MPFTFNLNNVAAFFAVAKTGSFRGAAERIHTSQSAVSGRVRQLEEQLGVRLFHRTTRAVRLTARAASPEAIARAAALVPAGQRRAASN